MVYSTKGWLDIQPSLILLSGIIRLFSDCVSHTGGNQYPCNPSDGTVTELFECNSLVQYCCTLSYQCLLSMLLDTCLCLCTFSRVLKYFKLPLRNQQIIYCRQRLFLYLLLMFFCMFISTVKIYYSICCRIFHRNVAVN